MPLSHAVAALKPSINTAQIRNFTRITFNWPEKVRFGVSPFEGGVTLTFNQPTDISLNQIRSQLGGVLRSANASENGMRITLNFTQPYRVRHFISGKANGIDILGAVPAKAPPETATKQTAKSAEENVSQLLPAPRSKPALPAAEAQTAGVAATSEKTEAVAKNASAPGEMAGPVATMQTAPEAASKPPTEAGDAPAPATKKTADSAPEPVLTNDPFTSPVQESTAEAGPVQSVIADSETAGMSSSESPDAPSDESVAPPPAAAEAPLSAPLVVSTEPPKATAVEPRIEVEAPPAEFLEPSVTQQIDSSEADEDDPFLITTYALATGTEIRFPWVERTAAAVFMRDDTLWIIFDKKRNINTERLKSILPAAITDVQQVEMPGYLALRMQTDGSVYPRVSQPSNSAQWWVTLSIYQQIPGAPVAVTTKASDNISPHVFIPILQYANPVEFMDPVVGDSLFAVPFFTSGQGVYPQRTYPEFTLLSTAQGLAGVKKDDFLEVTQLRNGFKINRDEGLSLSQDLPELALAELESFGASITWFPYDKWAIEPGQLYQVRRELEAQLHSASDVRANSLRVKLAQLYLGEGMGNEALAWLKLVEENDPFFFRERQLEALRGAAYFINDNYAAAKRSFAHETLKDNKERNVWLDALNIFAESRPRFDYLDYFQTYVSKYPPLMREKLGIIAADNYINRKSFSRALKTLDTLNLSGIRDQSSPYVYFLLGKVAAENGNIQGAKELWEPLINDSDNRFVRATADFALTTLLYNNGEIERKEAIERLDRLRIVWRGDALEMTLLNYLGDLYQQDGDYVNALRAWQEMVQQFPDAPEAIDSAQKMATAFNFIFSPEGRESLSPLESLAAFYEFRQLTPIGGAGDEMILTLADRLIEVDLLDRAAALLEHQIRFRREKLARSQLGAQLALVYLMNEKPDLALEKLELTGYGDMPADLALRRKRLAALAMADNKEPQRAIEMLSYDNSREADAIRLRLYWDMRAWPNIIAMGERLLGSRPDMTAPLQSGETEQLMQLAIAYMFERDRVQLQYLRNYFGPLLDDGPNKEIFMFVTDVSGPIDPQKFEAVSEEIARYEDFLDSYRSQVEEGGLTPMVN